MNGNSFANVMATGTYSAGAAFLGAMFAVITRRARVTGE
jgi:hypothetical protein